MASRPSACTPTSDRVVSLNLGSRVSLLCLQVFTLFYPTRHEHRLGRLPGPTQAAIDGGDVPPDVVDRGDVQGLANIGVELGDLATRVMFADRRQGIFGHGGIPRVAGLTRGHETDIGKRTLSSVAMRVIM